LAGSDVLLDEAPEDLALANGQLNYCHFAGILVSR
jgi:hypothetical protein